MGARGLSPRHKKYVRRPTTAGVVRAVVSTFYPLPCLWSPERLPGQSLHARNSVLSHDCHEAPNRLGSGGLTPCRYVCVSSSSPQPHGPDSAPKPRCCRQYQARSCRHSPQRMLATPLACAHCVVHAGSCRVPCIAGSEGGHGAVAQLRRRFLAHCYMYMSLDSSVDGKPMRRSPFMSWFNSRGRGLAAWAYLEPLALDHSSHSFKP